jgi:hypothetical protein
MYTLCRIPAARENRNCCAQRHLSFLWTNDEAENEPAAISPLRYRDMNMALTCIRLYTAPFYAVVLSK